MKAKHTGCVAVAIMLAMCLSFTLFWADLKISVKANPNVIHVPDDYEKIQWAINNASAGSTIIVSSGIYYEHLTIDKALTLQGENKESVIDGNGTGNVIEVTANNVNISGFTIQNSGLGFWDSGIHTYHSNHNNISHNIVINNGHGLWLECSNNNTLTNNNISNNQCGIGLSFSNNNTIANNNVSLSDECGIGLDWSNHNIVTGNVALNNNYGIWLYNSSYNSIFCNDIINNTNQAKCVNSTNTLDKNGKGNYWSDYEGEDADHDGIGDTPYIIDVNNIDHYPLMETIVIPEFSSNMILLSLMILALATTVLLKRKSYLKK